MGAFTGPKGSDLYEWVACIQGPKGSVYEGGIFFLDMSFPKEFPFKAPKVRMSTFYSLQEKRYRVARARMLDGEPLSASI